MSAIEVSVNREICCQYTEIMHSFRVVLSQSDHPSGANEAPGTGQNMACAVVTTPVEPMRHLVEAPGTGQNMACAVGDHLSGANEAPSTGQNMACTVGDHLSGADEAPGTGQNMACAMGDFA